MSAPVADTDGHGLIVLRASRLETLLDALRTFVANDPPRAVLEPLTVIAAHPGMKHWLTQAWARAEGPGGIVANLEVVLPSTWLDQLAQQRLHGAAVALQHYRREHLRWRIHDWLDTATHPLVQRYLRPGPERERRRVQLADRLARVYSRYLVYRPDWLQRWAQGGRLAPDTDDSLLASLWQHLRQRIGQPHRGELLQQLHGLLQREGSADDHRTVHVFGTSHLAPQELALLSAVARWRQVVLYVPDPCRDYWLEEEAPRRTWLTRLQQAGQGAEAALDTALDMDLLEAASHPLLGAWGRLGQHFLLNLEAQPLRADIRLWAEGAADPPPAQRNRLQRLQASLRARDLTALTTQFDAAHERADASLRVHVCHTRLRELEVLRDALLQARHDDPGLLPRQIVVMAPDIQTYLPLLPAVFGEAGRFDGPLPYHTADIAVKHRHPLYAGFAALLQLIGSRMTAPDVAALLEWPPVQRRLRLDATSVTRLHDALAQARVAWGLDSAHRGQFDVPTLPAHTLAWGMDRLLGGYLMGGDDSSGDGLPTSVALDAEGHDALAPIGGWSGPQAADLGALDTLLQTLQRIEATSRSALTASAWAQQLEGWLDALFASDPLDAAAREADAGLRAAIRRLASEPALAGVDPALPFAVVRDLLLQLLDGIPERQPFLLQGITFCGMVPQRAIPFDVIAVLGLQEGQFPRQVNDAGLDLMTQRRRLGDRDVRSDDRYLFLETVMSARQRLHLSYVGEGVQDGQARPPAAPLAELEQALLDAWSPPNATDAVTAAPWRVQHAMQPFEARYGIGDDPAFVAFAAPALPTVAATVPPPAVRGAPSSSPLLLQDVLGYFRQPARSIGERQLGWRLDGLSSAPLRDQEPLDAQGEAIDRVGRRLFLALAGGAVADDALIAPLQTAGLLPAGRLGLDAGRAELAEATRLLESVADHPLFAGGLPPPTPLAQTWTLGPYTLQGTLTDLYRRGDEQWLLQVWPARPGQVMHAKALTFKDRIPLFLHWALARLAQPDPALSNAFCLVLGGKHDGWADGWNQWDAHYRAATTDASTRAAWLDDLQRRVIVLLDVLQAAPDAPLHYLPKTCWVACQTDDDDAIVEAWEGTANATGERHYSPGHADLLAGLAGTPTPEQWRQMGRHLHGLISVTTDDASTEATA